MNTFFSQQPLLLAPMAGYTDVAFRALCQSFGCDLAYSEMVSAKGLLYGNERTETYLALGAEETHVAVQLFGHEPPIIKEAIHLVQEALGDRLFCIDLNMGCPAHKIVSNGDGSALMLRPALAGQIVRAATDAAFVPVTVKFRKGYEEDTCVSFAKVLADNGASALTLHPRTRAQQYSGAADYACIRAVKQAVSVPVIGNGDVTDVDSYRRIRNETGCDGVMIGRGALGRPWIFALLRAASRGEDYPIPDRKERMALAYRHAERILAEKGERGLLELRKHMPFYLHGLRGASELRVRANHVKNLEELREILLDS